MWLRLLRDVVLTKRCGNAPKKLAILWQLQTHFNQNTKKVWEGRSHTFPRVPAQLHPCRYDKKRGLRTDILTIFSRAATRSRMKMYIGYPKNKPTKNARNHGNLTPSLPRLEHFYPSFQRHNSPANSVGELFKSCTDSVSLLVLIKKKSFG